mmetsp:Transcript_12138/g.18303  ORF Transcript_12138/g.18303 Transcript_12138/m.18303 type:complete len:90 (-) Transcript_12138:17-286(-)
MWISGYAHARTKQTPNTILHIRSAVRSGMAWEDRQISCARFRVQTRRTVLGVEISWQACTHVAGRALLGAIPLRHSSSGALCVQGCRWR